MVLPQNFWTLGAFFCAVAGVFNLHAQEPQKFDLTTPYKTGFLKGSPVPGFSQIDRFKATTLVQEIDILQLPDGRRFYLQVEPLREVEPRETESLFPRSLRNPLSTLSLRMHSLLHRMAIQHRTAEPPRLYPRLQPVNPS